MNKPQIFPVREPLCDSLSERAQGVFEPLRPSEARFAHSTAEPSMEALVGEAVEAMKREVSARLQQAEARLFQTIEQLGVEIVEYLGDGGVS